MKQIGKQIGVYFLPVLLGAFIPLLTFAHGDHHEKIAHYTELIRSNPEKADNYFYRGAQYQSHGDFEEALKDFKKVLSLGASELPVEMNLSILYFEHDMPDTALLYINRFIHSNPEHHKAYQVRGDIYRQLGRYEDAAPEYRRSLELDPEPGVEIYMAICQNYVDGGDIQPAIELLQEGNEQIGPLPAFQEKMIELEAKLGHWSAAHEILDQLILSASRKESWYLKKAELYQAEGLTESAEEYYLLASSAIGKLSPAKRNTDHVRSMEATIKAALEGLDTGLR